MATALSRAEVVVGAQVKHIRTGGSWTVEVVNEDGSIYGRSDMGARRTVSADHVERGLELARMYAEIKKEQKS